jgi:hypothetical protein
MLSASLEISGLLHCAVPNALLLEDVEGGSLSELNVLRHPIQVEDSFFVPPSVPGHGITFDWETLARWEVAIDAVVDAMLQTDTPDGKIVGANPPPARGNVIRTRVPGTYRQLT